MYLLDSELTSWPMGIGGHDAEMFGERSLTMESSKLLQGRPKKLQTNKYLFIGF
jgi:hypothetical protein